MLKYLFAVILSVSLSGCFMIGKDEFSCKNSEDLKDAGTCGSAKYILENKDNIEEESYKGFVKVKGTYMKCDDDECLEEDEIKKNKKVIEKW